MQGPFAGMHYVEENLGSFLWPKLVGHYFDERFSSLLWPKLLGTYEVELAERLETWLRTTFATVLVAGAAEGYYAVGLARRCRQAKVIAWESNSRARAALRSMAERNGVADRLEIRGHCDPESLCSALAMPGPVLLLLDVEGDEVAMLEAAAPPAFAGVHLLVETHDFISAGITEKIERRLSPTHVVERIEQMPRNLELLSGLSIPSRFHYQAQYLMDEKRSSSENRWLACTPRATR
jgi:hypothetical protein